MQCKADGAHAGVIKGPVCNQASLIGHAVLQPHVVQDLLLAALNIPDAHLQ